MGAFIFIHRRLDIIEGGEKVNDTIFTAAVLQAVAAINNYNNLQKAILKFLLATADGMQENWKRRWKRGELGDK